MPAPDDGSSAEPEEPILLEAIEALPIAQVYEGDAPADEIVLEVVEDAIVVESETPPALVPTREIVLIGAGHAHLQIVHWWRKRPLPNVRMTLISAFGQAAFSSMLSGVIAGQFQPDDMLVDLSKLCARSNVEFIVDRAIRLDPASREIELAHQPSLRFDAVSINIGSVPSQEALWQSHRMLLSVKPLATFWQRYQARQQELLAQWRDAAVPKRLQFAIVGAGATGLELALCLEERIHNEDLPIDLHLVDSSREVWPGASVAAIRRVRKLLQYRGIAVHLEQRVVDCDQEGRNAVIFEDGSRLRCDLAIWATTATPPAILQGFQLPRSDRGFLLADRALRTSDAPPVFAVGDTADLPFSVPKSNANSIFQAPTLWHNLRAVLTGQPLKVFTPQSQRFTLLTCGDGTAILDYKGWALRSKWAWWWKCWKDRASIKPFQ